MERPRDEWVDGGMQIVTACRRFFSEMKVRARALTLASFNRSFRTLRTLFNCQDLDATCASLKESGFQLDGPTTRPWGERDALVVDPDGNLVEFGQAHGPKT
ncbi:MAG: hypothetical protein J2P56_01795 [Verrucomicrobia bacterium]|nr:hypothetical protein [Verrucomicrobiota bacterium]